ncbi:MAG: 16S rRNA (cytosine(1402)-N(4))-methyltransferase, partial [Candidatus Marinimicrobia bacterium]|nr:16S rRNA (cytosine(1402)-N(4))-methyltransferase [Candidatus Neomarinimicrobiota bacterium]
MTKPPLQGPLLHVPVLATEVLSALHIFPDGVYFDGTIGVGGHAALILQQLSSQGRYIGIDRDEEALSHCKQRFSASSVSVSLHHGSYHNIKSILERYGVQ